MAMYENLWDLLQDVRRHIKATGRPVKSGDDPTRLLIGYRDGDLVWHIRLSKVRNFRSDPNFPKDEIARTAECMMTVNGRLQLVNSELVTNSLSAR